MTFKEIVVLIGVLGGIYANLLFQDSLATGKNRALMTERLQDPSPALITRERHGQVTDDEHMPISDADRALD